MTSCSTPSKRARSSALRYTTYSLGTYVRLTETVRCSSISLASLRASSTGRTSDLKTRPNVPSTRPAIFSSRLRRTLMGRGAHLFPGQHWANTRGVAADPCYGRSPRVSPATPGGQYDRQHAGGPRPGDQTVRGAAGDGLGGRRDAGRPRRREHHVHRDRAAADQERKQDGRAGPHQGDERRGRGGDSSAGV